MLSDFVARGAQMILFLWAVFRQHRAGVPIIVCGGIGNIHFSSNVFCLWHIKLVLSLQFFLQSVSSLSEKGVEGKGLVLILFDYEKPSALEIKYHSSAVLSVLVHIKLAACCSMRIWWECACSKWTKDIVECVHHSILQSDTSSNVSLNHAGGNSFNKLLRIFLHLSACFSVTV